MRMGTTIIEARPVQWRMLTEGAYVWDRFGETRLARWQYM